MASVNKVILVGGLGRDPEVRFLASGEAVANFSIATTETWKDKQGVKQEKTEWTNVVAYRRLAEIIGEYLKKGSQCYIEGKLSTRKWEKDGVTRYATEVVANHMQMLGQPNKEKDTQSDSEQNRGQSKGNYAGGFDDMPDDFPDDPF